MISITVKRDSSKRIRAFTAKNHSKSNVCAAVSMMVINTVNSIGALTGEPFDCKQDKKKGNITFSLKLPEPGEGALLLLEAMYLGLSSVKDEYGKEIEIKEVFI